MMKNSLQTVFRKGFDNYRKLHGVSLAQYEAARPSCTAKAMHSAARNGCATTTATPKRCSRNAMRLCFRAVDWHIRILCSDFAL